MDCEKRLFEIGERIRSERKKLYVHKVFDGLMFHHWEYSHDYGLEGYKKCTQDDLCGILGNCFNIQIGGNAISDIENGKKEGRYLTFPLLSALSELFQVSISYLVADDFSKSIPVGDQINLFKQYTGLSEKAIYVLRAIKLSYDFGPMWFDDHCYNAFSYLPFVEYLLTNNFYLCRQDNGLTNVSCDFLCLMKDLKGYLSNKYLTPTHETLALAKLLETIMEQRKTYMSKADYDEYGDLIAPPIATDYNPDNPQWPSYDADVCYPSNEQ